MFAHLIIAGAAIATSFGPFPRAPIVGDAALGQMRGGFRLPSGIDVSLAIVSQTAVNGLVVLQSVFKLDTGAPQISVYAPNTPFERAAQNSQGTTIRFDQSSGNLVVAQGGGGTDPAAGAQNAADLTPLALTAGGAAVATAGGAISLESSDLGNKVRLDGDDLTVSHLFGGGYGSVIENSGSNRAIDSFTTISIDIGNAGPDVLGSALLRAEGVAMDATRAMVR